MPIYKSKNEHFFKKWTPEMAYVLGFFWADGNLTQGVRGNYYLEFTSTDKEILERIRAVMESGHAIVGRKRSSKWKMAFRIQIGSKIMFSDLIHLGYSPRKSKKLLFPAVPTSYLADFIRGYFDGDGHVTMGKYRKKNRVSMASILLCGFTCGTENFLTQLKEKLTKNNIVRGGTLYGKNGAYRLAFAKYDSLNLYSFLYKNLKNNLYLPRKKEVFERYMYAVVA